MKRKTIESFFKKVDKSSSSQSQVPNEGLEQDLQVSNEVPAQAVTQQLSSGVLEQDPQVSNEVPTQVATQQPTIESDTYERDPGKHPQIDDYPPNKRDEVRRFYINEGPFQPYMDEYPFAGSASHRRRFQYSWFKSFSWLEYSPSTERAYCFPCFLFATKPHGRCGSDTFTVKGWRKVNGGKQCYFLTHMGQDSNSAHNFACRCYESLKNKMGHIENLLEKQNSKAIGDARLRLKTSIDAIRWLTFQACAFRGHDEPPQSINQGNFLEMVKILACYNKEVKAVVLENANAKYTSHKIQKEILHIFGQKVQTAIRDEIGTSKFCLIVDESRDTSKQEQMAIVLRFVDREGFIRERFLDLVHVRDTAALTLKNSICTVLSNNNLSIQDIRGQGYDGASNMRGEWNGLQDLILKDCPYAYYVHCMAHQLQLALIAASREAIEVHNFFQEAIHIVNIVSASAKRNDELISRHVETIIREVDLGELDTGKGLNQVCALQRPTETGWSSHYKSICSLRRLFDATVSVLRNLVSDGSLSYNARGDAGGCLKKLLSFDFVFIMHLMIEIMAITDDLCHALQQKSLDILNAIDLVSTTKMLIQRLRDDGWELLLEKVNAFCLKHEVELLDMNCKFVDVTKSRNKHDNTTVEHHYRVDIFIKAIDQQQKELNARFSEQSMELLTLSAALDLRDVNNFCISKICTLAKRYYPTDFTDQDRARLSGQLPHYEFDVRSHPSLQISKSLADLTHRLAETGKCTIYPMVDRLLRLIMTLPVSTATTERAFSAMKLIKTALRNRMGEDYLRDYMIVYIEKEIAKKFNADEIIDTFDFLGSRRDGIAILMQGRKAWIESLIKGCQGKSAR
ncbi:zinc finger MYM-type-like protein [Rhynchospora pubera]|uniref:Zinc finger MYM-type-like protein n=1 Tax=Rhynchospora pubera TaxID=906938 RepID=A0AAV8CVQ6_9POAL|nr:zinc finger MYM-type-like protein [Rhynchospora pubera]